MLVLLDDRTFTSGEDTAKFIEHIHEGMRIGVHMNCIHEFPSVVGPPRHECDFGLFFNDDWTPAHLTGGLSNLYKEIAFALKGVEWRQPGLVAVASKIAGSVSEHKPIAIKIPDTYVPKKGPNKWKINTSLLAKVEAMVRSVDSDRDYIVSSNELHVLLAQANPSITPAESSQVYTAMLKGGCDHNGDGQISAAELAAFWVKEAPELIEAVLNHPPLPVQSELTEAVLTTTVPRLTEQATKQNNTFGAVSDRLKDLFSPTPKSRDEPQAALGVSANLNA